MTSHRDRSASPNFDWTRESAKGLPPIGNWRYRSLWQMLQAASPEEDSMPLLLGADSTGLIEITLADLRRAASLADNWRRDQGFAVSDSLLLVRLPTTSEAPLAAAVIALMTVGIRVVLPMSFSASDLAGIAKEANCRALLWCSADASSVAGPDAAQADLMYRAVAAEVGIPTFSIDGELKWHHRDAAGATELEIARPFNADDNDREALVLSTSGSTGRPKLVRYTAGALLAVAEAWNAAGLMDENLTGGRSICPAVSHSMGFRNVFHAVWNRRPTMLAQPEWLEERPKQYVKLLERCRPQHITCGPALLGDLVLLAASIERVRQALGDLTCVVSSGAADLAIERPLPAGVTFANAFGMTETQQVLNTLLGASADVPGALGSPLPGAAVAVAYTDSSRRVGRLFVRSPFMARGYVGSPDLPEWFETGDLVRVQGDDLVWVGRTGEDFLNTGSGIKIALADLRQVYQALQRRAEAVVFVPLSNRGGLGALVYLGDRDPKSKDVQAALLEAINADHRALAEQQQDFALRYMTLSAIGCVAGGPPWRGPGKLDQSAALHSQRDLIKEMERHGSSHPQLVKVPPYGSDRPDWREYAAGGS